jgi:two-component system sensor histidine kinase ResE
MFNKKIASKLTAGFIVIVMLSMLTIGILFIQLFRQYTFDSIEKTMLTRAHNISDTIAENTQSNGQMRGFRGFMHFIDTLAEAKVWITDSRGNPAEIPEMGMGMSPGHSFSPEPLPAEAEEVMRKVLSGKDSVSESFSGVYKETTLTVGVPILDSYKRVTGSVFLHSPVTGITGTLNKAISILSVSLLASLLLAVGLGIFYSLLFTKPLKAMNHTAIEMARGNYSVRTGISRQDEFGQLGNSLDLLASKLSFTIDQLFQEKGKITDIISSISEGIVAFDLKLQPQSFNNALSAIMNRSLPYQNKLLEKDLKDLKIGDTLRIVIEEKKSLQILKDWMDKRLKFTLSPILDNQANVTGCVALVQDISESEHLEQLRKDFVANVSHEFRTPLTIIEGSLEALIDGTVDSKEDIERYHQRMLSETRGLERLVGDLLVLSRLQSGKISINKEEVHIPSLLSDIIKNLQTIADKKQIAIISTVPESVPPVMGDYDRLRQLFVIFIDNAIKYSPDKTHINLGLRISSTLNTLDISIQDHGYGISEKELPHVWDRFYKSDKSRKSIGTGLGLAIAKHLVQLHDGKVFMQSKVGEGTMVTVQLPFDLSSVSKEP